jgi:hypothetical protein
VTLVPDTHLELTLHVAAHRFLYRGYHAASFGAAEGELQVRYRIDRRQSLLAGGQLGGRHHPGLAYARPGEDLSGRRREDAVVGAHLGYSYRGPFTFQLSYAYVGQQSNSYGETLLRHQLVASGGVRLPWQLTAVGQLTLQLLELPDGPPQNPDVTLVHDEETQNSISVKLARPLSPQLDVEARYALYAGFIPQPGMDYLRQVATVGITWRP